MQEAEKECKAKAGLGQPASEVARKFNTYSRTFVEKANGEKVKAHSWSTFM